jgi:hypothetical protein
MTNVMSPGGSFRENLYGAPAQPHLPDNYPGSRFKWNAPKAKGATETETGVIITAKEVNRVNGVSNGITA